MLLCQNMIPSLECELTVLLSHTFGHTSRGTVRESIGVQHCSSDTIRKALENPKEYLQSPANEIQFDSLYEMRLVQSSSERVIFHSRRVRCSFCYLDRRSEIKTEVLLWILGHWILRWQTTNKTTQQVIHFQDF